ncbi:MAG: tRNA uridine-5-carboxymethylaminomethyl(34) synthesis enzyme MnmG [FCB group bacterium]|nr:tRNA uridine-5-carboxymethylaminomethyl(34) synthesis enzyme MnmG [FCB group bacterium]
MSSIIVAGGGHAGVEAAIAAAKLGVAVELITISVDSIARMSCNPAIGGLAKGQIVKEIDALGGIMGLAADVAGIQFKMLNKSKGRAVWSPRAQVDKRIYSRYIRERVASTPNLTVREGEVVGFHTRAGAISSVTLSDGTSLDCSALIITTGTFQNGLIHIGHETYPAGRFAEKPSRGLTECLIEHGFSIGRLKTGTPPRLKASSINWEKTDITNGDDDPVPFSVLTEKPFHPPNIPCHIVYTGNSCHEILSNSLEDSALFSGKISGVGPRYCPSIEDKIVRFPTRDHHQLFLEPEWLGADQIYLNGFSTSMPRELQLVSLRTIPGLSKAEIIRPGYAIEYDYCQSTQLKRSLETKLVEGLFCAGQINGTSGYEEAAAQGLIAGVNAARKFQNKSPLTLLRSEAYIGVLIDDLTTKYIGEPYRMFTSSAEYRLSLRPDSADLRLTELGYKIGLVSENQYDIFKKRLESIADIKHILHDTKIKSSAGNNMLPAEKELLHENSSISSLINTIPRLSNFTPEDLFTAETDIKYAGYIAREKKRIEQINNFEDFVIPPDFEYSKLGNLSSECIEKLSRIKPESIGQASRIAGVKPSDVSVLAIYLKR